MEDKFGRQIEAGDTLAYATRSGSWTDINVATVDEVVQPKEKSVGGQGCFLRCTRIDGTRVSLRAPTAVIVNGASLTAMRAAKEALDKEFLNV